MQRPGVLPARNRWSILFFLVLALAWGAIWLYDSPWKQGKESPLSLDVTAETTGLFQVFWAGPDQVYEEKRSARIVLRPGRQEQLLAIPPLHEIERLRLDPADRETELVLHALRLEGRGGHDLVFNSTGQFAGFTPLHDIGGLAVEGDGLKIAALGPDPQIEIHLNRPGRPGFIRNALLAAFFSTLVMTVFFRFLHSDRHQPYTSSSTMASSAGHVVWLLLAAVAGVFLVAVTPFSLPPDKKTLLFISWSLVSGACVYLASFCLATRPVRLDPVMESRPAMPWSWLNYALPCYLVWVIYLLAFWPGSLSPDSTDQWREVVTGHFTDWNPAFHTMIIWVVTRAWLSPAMAILAQIAALGAVAGWSLSVLERYGVPRLVIWCACLVFALLPVNGLMAVTLWKDIAYSTALLALTTLLFQIVMSRGQWLDTPRSWLSLGLVLFLVAILRHNGIVPALLTPPLLFFLYRRYWWKILGSAMVGLVLLVVVRGPVYGILDVRRGTPMDYVYASVSGQIRTLVDTFSGREKPSEVPVAQTGGGTEKKKSSTGPLAERLSSSSRLWRIKPLQNFHRRIEYVNVWIKFKGKEPYIKYINGKAAGVTEDSVLPGVQKKIFRIFQKSTMGAWFFIWRPAVFLYVFLFCMAVAAYRIGSGKLLLLTAPILLNSLPTLFIVIHKSIFRYHYSIVIVSLLFSFSLLFLDRGLYRGEESR